jgi:hypothetical protein
MRGEDGFIGLIAHKRQNYYPITARGRTIKQSKPPCLIAIMADDNPINLSLAVN